MATQRLSFDIDQEEHKYLKMCCAKLGVSIKDFLTNAMNEKIESYEDEWLFADSLKDNDGPSVVFITRKGVVYDV